MAGTSGLYCTGRNLKRKENYRVRDTEPVSRIFYASSEKNLGEEKEPSSLERTSFLLRFGEHRDNSRNSQACFS